MLRQGRARLGRRAALALVLGVALVWARSDATMDLDARSPYAILPSEPLRLADLELAPVLVVTTVDGSVYGMDRPSGQVLWTLESQSDRAPRKPLVSTMYGTRSLEDLARAARVDNDPTLMRALQGDGLYIVEPSRDGDLYLLRLPAGASRPQLEKLPFTLPQLVALSPFSLSSDDTRIFVAEKHTSLVELNVFTGRVRAVYSSRAVPPPLQAPDWRASDADDDALESPWVYMSRTDYVLRIHTRTEPQAAQTLHYRVYGPNHADRDVAALWTQTPPMDHRAFLASPSNATLLCFNTDAARRGAARRSTDAWPVEWATPLSDAPVDVFDVVFAPPPPTPLSHHGPLLRPVLVPHDPGDAPAILAHARGDEGAALSHPTAYLGATAQGHLYALGQGHHPLVALDGLAGARRGAASRAPGGLFQPWVGGYEVPLVPGDAQVPLLGAPTPVPLLGAAPSAAPPTSMWTRRLVAQCVGLAVLCALIARGLWLIWHDRRAPHVLVDALVFDDAGAIGAADGASSDEDVSLAAPGRAPELDAPRDAPRDAPAPTVAAAPTVAGPPNVATPTRGATTTSDDAAAAVDVDVKKKRRRRGKRAGAAVLARQAQRAGAEPAADRTADDGDLVVSSPMESGERLREASPAPDVSFGSRDGGTSAAAESGTGAAAEGGTTALHISDEVLGYGSSGTVVFRGTFQGRAVAVKRLLRDFVDMASKEVSLLQSADNHPNVIRYYCQELTPNFLYIALEECPATLADLIERPLEFPDMAPRFEARPAFRQMAQGLEHLHSLSIVHRDVKPANILVSLTSQNKLRFMLSDFGLSKRIDTQTVSTATQSVHHAGGTVGWRAPELLRGRADTASPLDAARAPRLTRAVDIFSLGCVAFYMLTRGGHPFGELYARELHIWQHQLDLSPLQSLGEDVVEAEHLVSSMVAASPSARPTAAAVLQHPFFWPAQKRLAFLQDVSDRFETLERDPPSAAVARLESGARDVVGDDWRRAFDRAFLDDLGKFRSYQSTSVQDLLRVIRNKKHHFQDMPPALKKQLSPMPDGFLHYFAQRFPKLFMHVYQVLDQLPVLRREVTLRSYYLEEVDPS